MVFIKLFFIKSFKKVSGSKHKASAVPLSHFTSSQLSLNYGYLKILAKVSFKLSQIFVLFSGFWVATCCTLAALRNYSGAEGTIWDFELN